MDPIAYEQYCNAIKNGRISLDALQRIIRHDRSSEWKNSPQGLARVSVLQDCLTHKIAPKKLFDDQSDELYGINWPLPLDF